MSEFNKTPGLVLLPAVDVAGGKAVRLTQGEAGTETNYGDPVDAAMDWADQGAEWIHLVDLDAAFGRGSNAAILKKAIRQVRGVNVELSGGIRDDESLEHALEIGAKRINLGTAALENPEWAASVIAQYGEAIAVGLDVRGTTLAARGWTKEGGDLWQVLERLEEAGTARYVVTDVTKDGTLQGPNIDLLRQIMDRTARARSSRRAVSRASTTSWPFANSCRSASRARSWARHSTRARSRSPRHWMSRRTDDPNEPSTDAATAVDPKQADSAGVPWAGRSFEPNPHAADDGLAPPKLAAAIAAFRDGTAAQADVVAAFAESRLLIPLLAQLGDGGAEVGAHGLAVDKSQELSIVTVAGPDGRRVLPVFASVDAMSRWNPIARPVPADGVRVALAAADDGTELVVLDPGSPTEFVLRRPAVWAVAQSHEWQPPFESDAVKSRRSSGRSQSELAVLAVTLLAGDPGARLAGPELVVRLELVRASPATSSTPRPRASRAAGRPTR